MIQPSEVFKTLLPSSSDSTVWTIPAELPYFAGHFPGAPVFPGVGIVDASLHILGLALQDSSLQMRSLPSAKFTNPVLPNQRVRIAWQSLGERLWQVDWSDDSSAKVLASLRIQL